MPSSVVVTAASVYTDDGTEVARIEAVTIGGGHRIVGQLHGQDVTEPDPVFHRFHVRLLSPDRMIPDELREAETYDEAVAVAEKYAGLRAEHADRIASLASDLRV
jgi:hypothetical protein